jgi:excinuclease UvrABC ATPase subunit
MNDETMLMTHARRYFRAAAECQDLRKMEVLVDLGLDYLKLAARRKRHAGAGIKDQRAESGCHQPRVSANADESEPG